MPLSVAVWHRSLGKAGSWYNIESVHHWKREVLGRDVPAAPPNLRIASSLPFVLPLSTKTKCSVALRFSSLDPLADVLLRDNRIVRKHLS